MCTCIQWLSATHDTSASACHNFYEIIMNLSALNLLQQLVCICKAAYDCSFDLFAIIIIDNLFDSIITAHSAGLQFFHICTLVSLCNLTKNSFCDSSCHSKDYSGSGTNSKWYICRFDFNLVKHNSCPLNHRNQFGCCQNIIYVLSAIRFRFWTKNFFFLCRTWHN